MWACLANRRSFRLPEAEGGAAARELEARLRRELRPALNPDAQRARTWIAARAMTAPRPPLASVSL